MDTLKKWIIFMVIAAAILLGSKLPTEGYYMLLKLFLYCFATLVYFEACDS
jgi:hypothetical protein